MPSVAFYNNKGGVGKTCGAAHVALYAEQLGLKVVAAGLDRQGDLLRYLSRGKASPDKQRSFRRSKNLLAVYSPMTLPRMNPSTLDLLVADCPPAIQIASQLDPTTWVVPITGRLAFENLHNVLNDLRDSRAEVIVYLNRKGEGGKRLTNKLIAKTKEIKRVIFYERGVRQADAVVRSTDQFIPVWEESFAKAVAQDMQEFCRFVLNRCGITNF